MLLIWVQRCPKAINHHVGVGKIQIKRLRLCYDTNLLLPNWGFKQHQLTFYATKTNFNTLKWTREHLKHHFLIAIEVMFTRNNILSKAFSKWNFAKYAQKSVVSVLRKPLHCLRVQF